MTLSRILIVLSAAGACALLSGCTTPQLHVGEDFGVAVHQDVVAQVADPQPAYLNKPAPASDGAKSALSVQRYRTGNVIPPISTGASDIGVETGGSGAGAGAGMGAGSAPH